MQKMLNRLIALLLAVVLMAGLLPVNGISLQTAQAETAAKELETQSRNADALLQQTAQDFAALAAMAEAKLAAKGASDDGEWRYVLLPEYGYAVITGHHDSGSAEVDIPATLNGADVVALLSGVFVDHPALTSVTMAHNVYYAAPDALPRGVTVRGYNGSYAQKWASDHRCAFENLSELDFAIGVVDCSDVAAAYYVRHSESSVSLRALEANRLQTGSVFFLADPNDLYAVSYYQVTAVSAVEDGFVTFSCKTPEIQQVLNSFELTNAPMVPDWDTVEPAEDVSMLRTMPRGAESGAGFQGIHFKPSWDLGKKGKFELDIGCDISSSVSVKYAGLKVDHLELTNVQTLKLGGKIEVKDQMIEADSLENGNLSTEDSLRLLQDIANQKKSVMKSDLEVKQPLCSVTLVSIYGILNVALDVQFNITYSGSIELNYTLGTTTTYTYRDGKLTAKSERTGQKAELKAEAEVKVGILLSLKLYLTAAEVASISGFLGIKATAEYGVSYAEYINPDASLDTELLIQGINAKNISLATVNMMDCIDLSVNFVVEFSGKIGNDWLELISAKATLLDVPICQLHCHFFPFKYCMDGMSVFMQPKSFSDILHLARNCPMTDSVQLIVPAISKTEPMGSVTLYGATKLTEEPELELPEHHVRVTDWYRDEQMTDCIQFASGIWDLPVKSGDKLYGRTEQVGVINVINYKGETMKLADGSDAIRCLANTEALNLGHLDYENDHLIGWVEVKSPTDLTFVGEPIMRLSNVINGDLKDHTWLALCDNDLTIEFRNEDNQHVATLTTGHFVKIAQEQVPAFPVKFDPAVAVAVYEWRDKDKKIYEFPKYIDGSVGDELVLHMTYVDVQRVFEEDETPSTMGTEAAVPSGLTTYTSKNYYNYITTSEGVVIKGFKSNQSYVDEEGVTHEWTAVPEVLVIPSYIDDKPVTVIEGNAFQNLDTLVSVKLPSTIERIGASAFRNCPNLLKLDISSCSKLTSLPDYFAYGDTALTGLSVPGSVTSIGSYAFYGCTGLTAADINASIGASAFEGCTSLSSVTLRYRVSAIGANAFKGCTALTALTVPCSAATVGNNFISGCTSLRSLTFDGAPDAITSGIMSIGEGSSLTSLRVGLGVTTIGANAFSNGSYGNPNLTTITLPEALREVGSSALRGTAVEKLTIYDLGMLGTGFASSCTTLRELSFETGTINSYAFDGCTNLEKIHIGNSVYAIGDYAFRNCTSLTEVVLGDGVEYIGRSAFEGCSNAVRIELGDRIKTIGNYAFRNCSALEEIHFPPSVESFGEDMLYDCSSLKVLSIGGPNTPVLDGWNWFGSIDEPALETVIINEGIQTIADRCFSASYTSDLYRNLRYVSLPSTLTEIGDLAFNSVSALSDLALPEGLKHIGARAFDFCTNLTLICPDSLNLESVGENAFHYCTSLTSINLGQQLKSVGSGAFSGCSSLEELHFPPSVESFGEDMLYDCSSLKVLSIGGPNTPVLDGWNWFGSIDEPALETVIINEGIQTIADRCFSASYTSDLYRNLRYVSLPSTLTEIGDLAFNSATSLTSLTLPSSITTISSNAFSGTSLTFLHSPTYSTVIAEYAESIGVAYTCDDKVALTVMEGETTLYTGEVAIGTDISGILADCIPADHDAATFCGWFMNAECTTTWARDAMPAFPLTLYAGMVPVHTVTFQAMSGDEVLFTSTASVGEGFVVPWPEEPVVNGYRFGGWFTDAAMTTELAADARMATGDMTVYGRMSALAAGAVYTSVADGLMLTRFVLPEGADTEVWLPASVDGTPVISIAANCFADASAVTRLHLPDGLLRLESGAFNGLESLEWITTGPDCTAYQAINGVLYTADLGTLVYLPQRKPTVKLVVPDTVHTIAANACTRHVWLQTVELGDSVTTLGDRAFAGCAQLTSFTAYGLEHIGEEAIPLHPGMTVTGPVKTGALRSYCLLEDSQYPVFKVSYNQYPVSLYVNGRLVNTLGLEAGSTLPEAFLYGPMGDGTIIHTWFTDSALTIAWNRADATPEAELKLYAPQTSIYVHEVQTFTVNDTEVQGAVLTAYNGLGGSLVLPRSMGGYPVMALGGSFLAQCCGSVTSVQIGSEVIQIAGTALDAPEAYPFGGVVLAEPDSYAAQWAAEMGYTVNEGLYTLTFEANGGASIAPRQVKRGTLVRLPEPVRSGSIFLGWYLDASLTVPAELTDHCYETPAADVTLYAAWEGAATVWPFAWEEQDGSVVITAYTGNVTELTIPDTINGLNVTAIRDFAFVGAPLEQLTLPGTMESIGANAFAGAALTSLDLGCTKTVHARAFAECAALSSVSLPQVTTLSSEAFADCTSLTTLHLPATLSDVDASAFRGCTSLETFTVDDGGCLSTDDGVLLLGSSLLRYPPAHQATAYTLPDSITRISAYAFADAACLTNIALPDALEQIGMHAFDGCTSLTAIVLTDAMAVTNIPESAFSGCSSLAQVVLGSSVTSIDQYAFRGCDQLAEIRIPASVTSIDQMAFSGLLANQLTIVGDAGSAASSYAAEHGFAFTDLSGTAVTALSITSEPVMLLGDIVTLTVQAEPADAALNGEITWSSSAPEVIYLYGSEAHAIAEGTALITATAPNGVSTSITMEVRLIPIVPSAGKLTLLIGQQVMLNLDMPEGGTLPACSWQSTAPEVAEVAHGSIRALTAGTTDITCTLADSRSFCIPVNVVDSLTTMALPQALTVIDDEAFLAAGSVQRVVLGGHVTSIGSLAFAQMASLQQILLPASVTSIANDAFAGSDALVILCEQDSAAHIYALAQEIPYVLVAN